MNTIFPERLRAVVAAIPAGRWASYGDVAHAAGGTDRHARTLNQRFIREDVPNAHRVLRSDGTLGENALGSPPHARQALEDEGVYLVDGRADPQARVALRVLTDPVGRCD